ncbi:cytochrome P450 [Delphinella strobiligena]|nr:cytochrome P450 [Delphinella strobiligena]
MGSWSLIITSAVVYLIYKLSTTFDDVYLGPMSKFPGPKLWAATALPSTIKLWRGEEALAKHALHDKYGPVVRVTPTELSYSNRHLEDPTFYGPTTNGTPSIINVDDATHSRYRRILAHAFSDRALKEQEPLFKHWADMLVGKLLERSEGSASTPVDMVSWWNFATFDIMADLTFAESLGMLEQSSYSPWVKTIFAAIKVGSRLRCIKLLPGMTTIVNSVLPNSVRTKQVENFKYSADRVDRRLARKDPRPDLWNQVLKHAGTDGAMSVPEMHSNSVVFMIAGTETTATLLSGLTYYLLQNPVIMSKLVDEIRTAFLSKNDITIEALQRLTYMNACMEEGLRMYPSVPTGMARRTSKGGARICGEIVPEDITVSVNHWAAFHSERNFHQADKFIPERWIGEEARFKNDDHTAFQPFLTGPRGCLGRNLAYHEAQVLVCSVLWHFDLALDQKSSNWAEQRVHILWEKAPLWVSLKAVARETVLS